MKKLCLIIPILLIPSLLAAEDGVDGCHITTGATMQSRLYYTPYTYGSGSPTEWIESSAGHAGYNLVTSVKCFDTSNIPCNVYQYGTTAASPSAAEIVYTGYYALVTTDCPIDNYIAVFFIFTAGFSIFYIRKKASGS
ncbi:hypothetical protein [Pedobacter rhodius]|uniref:Uncharacterized protein n=1 Tax=Pedobacter rhodius TaxID=3004098 RepID=A0ABT4KSC0_9SPHI|nr:hypothetical protein [Pedobacter sp. SJ11]MCZ4221826.1 hypothetical protein [Pedobacter sp. SJ11]